MSSPASCKRYQEGTQLPSLLTIAAAGVFAQVAAQKREGGVVS